jgi:hypothetical protein
LGSGNGGGRDGEKSRQGDIAKQLAIDHHQLHFAIHAGLARAPAGSTTNGSRWFPALRSRNDAPLAALTLGR